MAVFLTRRQLADKYPFLTATTLRKLAHRKKGPPYSRPLHNTAIYDEDEFLAWARQNRFDPNSPPPKRGRGRPRKPVVGQK